MNKKLIVFLMCLLTVFALPLTAGTKKKMHTIGDSTMANYATDGSTEKRGWAQMLQQFFNADNITVNNRGKSGASSKSFYQESGYWNTLAKGGTDEMKSGDYLLIQFAHNDEKTSGTDGDSVKAYYIAKGDATTAASTDYRGTTAFDTYKKFMRKYINEAKAMGVTPIVVGPICRKYFSSDGKDITRSGRHDLGDKFNLLKDGTLLTNQSVPATDDTYDYVEAAKAVAAEYDDVPFIDLTTLTANLYISYGLDYCTDNLFNKDTSDSKTGDSTHPNALGATLIAREFVKQLVSQAASETDAKKKAVLQALAADAVLSNEITFNPVSGDLGEAMMGTQVVKEFNISAFGLASESGDVTVSTSDGFEVSSDNTTWGHSATLAYSGSTLTTSIYVRATTGSTVLYGTLTASDGTNSKALDLTLAPISIPGGVDAIATWPLSTNAAPNASEVLTLTDESLTDLKAVYGAIGTDSKKMQLLDPSTGSWGTNELDEVSTRYAQFKVTAPEGKTFYATNISYNVAARGGSAVSYHAYYSTSSDFSNHVLLDEKVSMTKDNVINVSKSQVVTISDGESLYIRLYPWYHNQSSAATGKYFCVSDMTISGIIADAVSETTFGIGRELDTTTNTFAADQEKVTGTAPMGATVTNISTCDYPGTNQTLKHGAATPTYTAPNVWRNYWNADPSGTKTVKAAYADGFYWGFKVSVPSGKALNISKIYSDVYGVKNTLTSKFVVKQSLEGAALYESDSHAANVESGTCAFTEDVSKEEKLQKLEGDVYFLMPWFSGSSATYYALKDFSVTATLANAEAATKYALTTSVSPAEGGSIIASSDATSIKEGTEVTLTTKKNFGYKFKEWQDESGATLSTETSYVFTMTADKSVNAIFESVPVYEVKAQCTNDAERPLGSVTITPNENNGKYEEGTEITATATTSNILKFLSWTDDNENAGTSATRTLTVTKDMTLTANYEVQDFIAVFDASTVQGYASNVASYPFGADLTWDSNRNALASVVKVSDGTAIKGVNGTPVVRNRVKVVIDGINGLYQNGFNTTEIAWQYQFSTKGFNSATFKADMAAKNAASKSYKAQYSLDGKSFTDLGDAWECTASVLCPISFALPADVMDKDLVYVRITGTGTEVFNDSFAFSSTDTESGLNYTTNSESGVGNVYILGEAQTQDDGKAPTVSSSSPVNGATGVSASGSVTISYSERIQKASLNADITLNGKAVTPTFNSRSISFPYANLTYGEKYTVKVPAGYVEDKAGNSADAFEMSFTVMNRVKPSARTFDAIVDASLIQLKQKDGVIKATADMPAQYRTIQAAIDAAPANGTKPYLIYIKNGEYRDPNFTFNSSYGNRYTGNGDETVNDLGGGINDYDSCRIVCINKPNINIIGQSRDNVIISTDRLDGYVSSDHSRVWYHINAGATFEVQAAGTDFHLENVTVDNENWTKKKMAGPQALCFNVSGDRAVLNNIRTRSYQDTYYNGDTRTFVNNSEIHGAVDFIYGNGDVWFENCVLNINRSSGGWIVAPSHPADTKWGYVFNNTRITTDEANDPSSYSISLGRPWHGNPKTVFLHTTMELTPVDSLFSETMGKDTGLPAVWAVYDFKNANGYEFSGAQSVARTRYYYTSSTTGEKVYGYSKNTISDDEASQYTITNVLAGDGSTAASGYWDPKPIVEKTSQPVVKVNGNVATWTADNYAICYVVQVNGKAVAFPTDCQYVGTEGDVIKVQSVNEYGALSDESAEATLGSSTDVIAVETNATSSTANGIYTIDGKKVSNSSTLSDVHSSRLPRGLYIENGKKTIK